MPPDRPPSAPSSSPASPPIPGTAELTRVFARIGCLSFGGPAAQIALMHRELVETRGWLDEKTFLGALAFCMVLPGPEAMQLATYSGWRLRGTLGGLIAGLLFVLPGAAVILALAFLYATIGDLPLVQALFLGVKAAVLVIVIEALIRIARRALLRPVHHAIAAAAFLALFVLNAPYPLVIAAAAVLGVLSGALPSQPEARGPAVDPRRTLRTVAIWLAVWLVPVAALSAALPDSILAELARFFSVLATVTFGGAYAVLAYMAQEVVSGRGWLSAAEMADALGLAETTPGPLILVTQFVGTLAALREGGVWMGLAGAVVTLWATFAPCFLWVFAGAPYIAGIPGMPRLQAALQAITAAVVGVILNLSIWFALQVTFSDVVRLDWGVLRPWWPDPSTLDWRVPVLTALAGLLLLRLKLGIAMTLAVTAGAGVVLSVVG